MIRKTLVFSLLLLILADSSSRMVIIGMWWMKQEYIAKNLCINRMKPMLHCDGKCILYQKLKQAEQKQKDQMPDLKNFKEFVCLKPSLPDFTFDLAYFKSKQSNFTEISPLYSQDIHLKIFKPPKV